MSSGQRREVSYSNLREAVEDARHLLSTGYSQVGNWNLSQTLAHCTDWLRFPMDGFPKPALPIRFILWLTKIVAGKRMREKILRSGRMKAGQPTLPSTLHVANSTSDAKSVDDFEEAVERFEKFNGQLHESPLFGRMTKDEVNRLHLIHLQHHLSFLLPRTLG